jgi:hypothetical protein
MFHGKVLCPLGFSRQREFIGGRAMSGLDQGPTPPIGGATGGPCHPMVRSPPGPALVSPLDSVFLSGK